MNKVISYESRNNVSRLSVATSESKASPYSGRVNVSRLSGVNVQAFVLNGSLYSRLGGDGVVPGLLRIFYGKALGDSRISRLFDSADNADQESRIRAQQVFLKAALGGGNPENIDVQSVYDSLAARGISAAQFDAVVEAIAATLRGQNVPPPLMDEVSEFCAEVRKRVVR